MRAKSNIVVVGEAGATADLIVVLRGRGHEVHRCDTGADCLKHIDEQGANLVILSLPVANPEQLLRKLKALDPNLDVVVTGSSDALLGVEALELGAFEYVKDPRTDISELLSAVGAALGSRREDVQLRYLRERATAEVKLEALVGAHPKMQVVFQLVRQICLRTSAGAAPSILLLGETGTGKGMLAKCIHYNSARRSRPFVEINCAAIPKTLIESELFGYERGAFTDARSSKPGLFETATSGTLFLDEIASLPLDLQAKLLTAIEEKRLRRLGSRETKEVDVLVIAASQPNLRNQLREGRFREDLYHRLNVLAIELPTLRERGEDKLRLAEAFVEQICREYGMPPRLLSDDARKHILRHTWPGNVRELRNQMERIILLTNDEIIESWHFDPPKTERPSARVETGEGPLKLSLPAQGVSLEALEREAIRIALDRTGGNVSKAARFLSISRQTLMYRMKKHGLSAGLSSSGKASGTRWKTALKPPKGTAGSAS